MSLLLILALLLTSVSQDAPTPQQPAVLLKNVQSEYKNLDEVKPELVNGSDHTIYLLREDCGAGQLLLFYMNKTWMQGLSANCAQSVESIVLKPGESYRLPP